MKKISFLVVLFMVVISCMKEPTDFMGFGSLNLGENFSSHTDFASFRKVMDGEFYKDQYVLSDVIGTVSDVSVSTENDTIKEVKFSTSDATVVSELDKIVAQLEQVKPNDSMPDSMQKFAKEIKMYTSKDEKIIVSVVKHSEKLLKNGDPVFVYQLISKDALMKNMKKTMKMIQRMQD